MDIGYKKLSSALFLTFLSPLTSTAYAADINPVIAEALEEPGFGLTQQPQSISKFAAVSAANTGGSDTSPTNTAELALARMNIKTEVTPETTELFGEKVDLNSGAISMTNTDLVIPGNFPIEMGITRVYKGAQYSQGQLLHFADWQLDIPSISTTIVDGDSTVNTWTNGKPCSGSLNPGSSYLGDGVGYVVAKQYWSGDFINVPSVGSERLLEPNTVTPGVTRVAKNWRITCQANGNSEAFIATSPQGITYTFSMLRSFPAERLPVPYYDRETNSTWTNYARVFKAYMQVTEVKDRFNNKVTYNYSAPDQLDSITSSDGRSIHFTYEPGVERKRIKSITSDGKTWSYYYRIATEKKVIGGIYVNPDQLSRVVLPDGREWVYDIDFAPTNALEQRHIKYSYGDSQQDDIQCIFSLVNPNYIPRSYVSRVTHPNGLKAEFEVRSTLFGRSQVPKQFQRPPNIRVNVHDRCFSNFSLIRKTLSGKGVSPQHWYYSYSQNPGQYADGSGDLGPAPQGLSMLPALPSDMSAMDLRSTTVVAPDGSKAIHVFDRRYNYSQDKEVATYLYDTDGTTLLQRNEITYSQGYSIGKAQLFSANYNGTMHGGAFPFENESQYNSFVNNIKSTIYQYTQDSRVDTYTKEFLNFNNYGSPELTVESNGFNANRKYLKNTYYHDLNNWLINLEDSNAISFDGVNYVTAKKNTYYPYNSAEKSSLYQEYQNGRLLSTHRYYGDGNIKQTTFNANNRWMALANYMRGKPQLIKIPQRDTANCANPDTCFLSASMVVDGSGNITKVTDFNGVETHYRYDSNNRVINVKNADTRWAETTISYDLDSSDNAALFQNITRGNYKKTVTLDGLMRPILVKEWDLNNESATAKYISQAFNVYGKPTFTSFPSTSPDETLGTAIAYDGLIRTTSTTRTSDNSQTTTQYLSGNQTAVTDGRGNTTLTNYLAYGSPSSEKATQIAAPDTDVISINYNELDQIIAITQGSITESRLYNGYRDLCKVVRPDTGMAAFGYNNVGEMIWRAEGTSGSTTSCDEASVPSAHRVALTYDNVGALKTEDFPDSTPDRQYTYDNNGNLKSLTTGTASWQYQYNSLNLPQSETLSIDGRSFALTSGYDSLGSVASLQYPSGAVVDFAPNALGQATKAGTYASGVSYYPNGQLKQFTYGNGIVRNVALDTTGRIDALTDIKAGSLKNSLDPSYDSNDNLTRLIDGVDSSNNISNLSYDGVDRLRSADGKWGTGRYIYDGLGNILSRSLNNSTINYHYSTLNRLNNLSGAYAYSYQYDTAGNITHNGRYSLSFNRAQQMVAAKDMAYVYDGFNRKIKQNKPSGTAYTVYNKAGQLLYREEANGKKTDSVYLGKQIVAEVDICPPSGCAVTQPATKTCPVGYSLNTAGTLCEKAETQAASISSYSYSCPTGYTLSGSTCQKTESKTANSTTQLSCPRGGSLNSATSMCSRFFSQTSSKPPTGTGISCTGEPMGGGMRLWECTETYAATPKSVYSCDAGWTLSGTNCTRTLSQNATTTPVYACPSGWALSGSQCRRLATTAIVYTCPSGWTLSGSQCTQ
ncbi:RHS repeat domain-containing protein [Shewanella putrefaciens]|uniref:RHS repeat domain-containing protein n=1 Tax=Shewanella putrefaciens TaxID=24 RepID=UPI003D7A86F1